jgi:glycosyltransferase involved in cell wall biosynthesis
LTIMSKTPRVSIGMPVFNGERYLSETIDSLLNQTFHDFELIIGDNASTDGTGSICQNYAKKDSRVKYFRNDCNLGAAKNYRRTLDLSQGEYFRWANADDLFAPESLQCCVDVLDSRDDVVLAYPRTKLIDATGKDLSDYADNLHLDLPRPADRFARVVNNLGLVNVIYGLIRTNPLRHTGLIRNFPSGDIPLIAELSLYGRFWEIQETLFYRRIHPRASSQIKNADALQYFFDPQVKVPKTCRAWKILAEHASSVRRAPISISEKFRIFLFLIKNSIQNRIILTNELRSKLSYK